MPITMPITVSEVTHFHDTNLAPPVAAPVFAWIEKNHRFNTQLWDEEDLARRTKASDADIAANKRAIDKFNQARNDAVERIDEMLLVSLNLADPSNIKKNAELHSETAGAMIDRLSILALKIRAMKKQTERTDVDAAHTNSSTAKLAQLRQQRADLAENCDKLLRNCAAGTRYFKVYRQFKMYNDPRYNPVLVAESAAEK
jgi:cell division protein FtsB